jgi:hypothetical protein
VYLKSQHFIENEFFFLLIKNGKITCQSSIASFENFHFWKHGRNIVSIMMWGMYVEGPGRTG